VTRKVVFFLIIVLAALLRLAYLAGAPPSLNWDEVSVGWNAYSLLTTSRDEYGQSFPLSIRSFNDYKPPLYTYATAAAMALLGKTEIAVRLPSALAGLLTVVLIFFLGRVSGLGGKANFRFAYLSAFLLSVSPWHIQLSRIAFEASLALFFFLFGLALILFYFRHPTTKLLAILSATGFVLSTYAHHSVKIFLPLFTLLFAAAYRQQITKNWPKLLPALVIGAILLLPLGRNMLYTSGQATRALTVSIFAPENQFHFQGKSTLQVLTENYLSHLDPAFLFFGRGDNPRHHAPDTGVVLLWTAPFIILGLIYLIRHRPKYLALLLIWFVLSPVPAILSIDNPHASRSFLSLPIYVFLTALGILFLAKRRALAALGIGLLLVFNLLYFFHQYFSDLSIRDAPAWQYGYKQLVERLDSVSSSRYRKIYVSTAYDQPYIYFLFYGHSDPWIKNDGSFSQALGKISFVNFKNWRQSDWDALDADDLLVLTSTDPQDGLTIIEEINYPDSQVAFRITQPISRHGVILITP